MVSSYGVSLFFVSFGIYKKQNRERKKSIFPAFSVYGIFDLYWICLGSASSMSMRITVVVIIGSLYR